MLGLVCFSIPLPAYITSKEPAKVYKRLLLVARRAKLGYRLTHRVLLLPLWPVPAPTPPLRIVSIVTLTHRVLSLLI